LHSAADRNAVEASRRLWQLNEDERSLSARRARLQDRIDFLRAGGGGPLEEVAGLIRELEHEERELSRRRQELHEEIELARSRSPRV
jgi:predicted  nucleic acid-binding Zn-ribbon protein